MQLGEVLDGFGEGAGGGARGAIGGGLGGFALREDVWGEEGEAEVEVGRGKDGQGFGEDIGRRLVPREVRVELISVGGERWVSRGLCGDVRLGFGGEL